MSNIRVADLTIEELNTLMEEIAERVIDRRLSLTTDPEDPRSVEEVLESIDRHMWTPPPGAKSSLELLWEDRDS